MNRRFALRTPWGDLVTRDVVDGVWADAGGDADEVFGEGLVALPGLVDAHAHLAGSQLGTHPGDPEGAVLRAGEALQAGVTFLLDKGWLDTTTIELIERMDPGERPDIDAAAVMIASPEGYYEGFSREVVGEGIVAVVQEEARRGKGWVKLIGDWPRPGRGPQPNFTEEELRSIVETAANEGSRVAIHTMAREVPSAAVAAGVQSIEHGLFLGEDDLDALAARGGMWVPTVLRAEALVDQLGPESSGGRLFLEGLSNLRRLLPLGAEAGVNILAGTDLVGSPANVASEAVKMGEYGLSNEQVVSAISTAAFLANDRKANFEIGATADAAFFEESPLDDLGVLAHPKAVLRMGRLI